MQRADLIERLNDYLRRYPDERATVERFVEFVRNEPRCFARDCWSGHVTGSAWVTNRAGTHVLLTHHRKLDRWLQLGGHSDGDADTLRVACREATEESGLKVEPLGSALFDVDIHPIPARRSDPEHFHYDARYALVALDEQFRVSAESNALRWVAVDVIETLTSEPSMLRMAEKWREFRRNRAP
jgi:8-oxo-dGTP pyrophosphatase MutT (NUDIX family)